MWIICYCCLVAKLCPAVCNPVDWSWRRQWHPTPVLLPGKSHGRRSLVGCSPWDRKVSDTTERLHFHFSLFMHWRRKWQPTPVFLPGESQGWGSLVGCHLWGRTVRHDWSDLATAAAWTMNAKCRTLEPFFHTSGDGLQIWFLALVLLLSSFQN